MAELKTQPSEQDIDTFLAAVEDEKRREDCRTVVALMAEVTGEAPRLWGGSMIGFGSYHYVYDSGREGDWFLTGVSPRKQSLTLYILPGHERYPDLMERLGRCRTGKSCIYVKSLEDIDTEVLRELVERSVRHLRETYD